MLAISTYSSRSGGTVFLATDFVTAGRNGTGSNLKVREVRKKLKRIQEKEERWQKQEKRVREGDTWYMLGL